MHYSLAPPDPGTTGTGMPELPLLNRLHDIHTPDGVNWWPLAPGWWLLALLGLYLLAFFIWQWYHNNRLQREAMAELKRIRREFQEHQQHNRLSMELNILLRRVALARTSRSVVAGLIGQKWLGFLDQRGGDGEFLNGVGQVLGTAPYAHNMEVDTERLLKLAERWIRRNR